MINSNAKVAIRKKLIEVSNKKRKKTQKNSKRIKHKKTRRLLTEESSDAGNGFETSKDDRTQQEEKEWDCFDEWEQIAWVKMYERSRSIWKRKKSTKSTNLKPSKIKLFLDRKNAHIKHKKYRQIFPTMKVIAYDINEIWSLDLAYVDKLATENKDVKYLLVAVDCLSRYLRVEPLKTKYATTTAEAFRRMTKNKRPKECG